MIKYAALILVPLLIARHHSTAVLIVLIFDLLFNDLFVDIRQTQFLLGLFVKVLFDLLEPGLFLFGATESVLCPLLGVLLKD